MIRKNISNCRVYPVSDFESNVLFHIFTTKKAAKDYVKRNPGTFYEIMGLEEKA